MEPTKKVKAHQVEIGRRFNADGFLEAEHFSVPPFILLARLRKEDGGMEETYLVNRKPVAADRYSKARVKFPDMPEADATLDGVGAVLASIGRTRNPSTRPVVKIDVAQRDEIERHAKSMLAKPGSCKASRFSTRKDFGVGSLTPKQTRNLLEKLALLGAVSITVFGVRNRAKESPWASGIVAKLPGDRNSRAQLIQIANKAAVKAGFDPYDDVGQGFVVFEPT